MNKILSTRAATAEARVTITATLFNQSINLFITRL